MGTVGLSFGSPTSGAGFDVSSTVAEIVGNIQNVESPWKNQLTSLESQDTAISSLGTLFSNLSTDVSQLTDFEGILAQKEGSSSDTNVLELTAANSTAAAGTHSVVIHNLAQTSSGSMVELANSADKLSGSVTLQVGNGNAQTITLDSNDNTLSGLASAINSSGVGVTAAVLTDATGSRLSLVSGTSGANGNIVVTGNSLTAAVANTLTYTGTAGTSAVNSTGTLSPVSNASAALSGTMSIQVGSGAAIPIDMSDVSTVEGGATLSDLESYINSTFTTQGVQASVVTNSDGTSSLQLNSQKPGSAGTLTVNSSLVDPATALGYTSTVTGSNANLAVDGVNLTSASNTVNNLIPGVTFQLLAPSAQESDGSLEQIQVVISNDNSGVESTVNQFVSDYNSVISAVNAQQGNTSSGTPEPLFGSPTLSLLQQELLSSINTQNPSGYLDGVSSSSGTTLSGSINISLANGIPLYYSGTAGSDATTNTGATASSGELSAVNSAGDTLSGSITIQVGSGTAQTINVGDSSTADTLTGMKAAINAANAGVTASIVTNADGSSSLQLESGTLGVAGNLTVTSSLADTSTQTIQVPATSGDNTVAGLASAINASHSGVTAVVKTSGSESTLELMSETEGSGGALTVTSALNSTSPTPLTYVDAGGFTNSTADNGSLGSVAGAGDTLSGSLTIQVGNGTPQTIALDSSNNTLAGLMGAVNGLTGVSAVLNDAGTGLTLTSASDGASGALIVTSNLADVTSPTATALNYSQSSDINSLTTLGIGVNNDGSLTFDANSLDTLLNSDYSSVVGFFQNSNGWGQNFSSMLNNAGSSSSTGILSLAAKANSTTESTLNAEVSKEQTYISAQQVSLTKELNQANQIMQELPSQLQGINELYSAISGYNQGQNG